MTVEPAQIPDLDVSPDARQVAAAIRAVSAFALDVSDAMRAKCTPPDWVDDNGTRMQNRLRDNARGVATTADGLQAGVVALDRFTDTADSLRARRELLESRRADLLRRGNTKAESDAPNGLESDVRVFDRDVERWSDDLDTARRRAASQLAGADTPTEARSQAISASDVLQLRQQLLALNPTDASAIHSWWSGLSRTQREELKTSLPTRIGNLDGIPIDDRDEANRLVVDNLVTRLSSRQHLTAREERLLDQVTAVRRALDRPAKKGDGDASVRAYLMAFDPNGAHGDGHAAVAYGNPQTADHVSISVPGLQSNVASMAPGGVSEAAWNQHQGASAKDAGSVASIAWIGYDAPDLGGDGSNISALKDVAGVTEPDLARAGARRLANFVDGLKVNDAGQRAHYTVVGHSYGSTTVAEAASGRMKVDDVVLAGSPGAGPANDKAADLNGHVWVGSADEDFVTRFGGAHRTASLGYDPAGQGFGGRRFVVADGPDFHLSVDGIKDGVDVHSGYFKLGSESLDSISNVIVGHDEDVTIDQPRRGENADWWRHEVDATRDDTVKRFGTGPFGGLR